MRSKGWGCAGLLLLLSSCGDDGPSSATAPTQTVTRAQAPAADFPSGTALSIVSGGNEIPVTGAEVNIGGQVLVSDASGTVTLSSDFNDGALVDITADGFLTRQTLLRRQTRPRLSLWPTQGPSGVTQDFIFDVVYHLSAQGESSHIMRIRPGTDIAFLVPTEQIRRDPRSMEAIADAIGELNEIAQGEFIFAVDPNPPAGSVAFEMVIDPNVLGERVVGRVEREFSGWNIIGGTIIYDSVESVRTSVTHHELGHMMGLGHSNSRADVMFPFLRRRVETFSARERLVMRIILDRPAATQQPDNDRNVRSAQSMSSEWISVIDCYE